MGVNHGGFDVGVTHELFLTVGKSTPFMTRCRLKIIMAGKMEYISNSIISLIYFIEEVRSNRFHILYGGEAGIRKNKKTKGRTKQLKNQLLDNLMNQPAIF